MARQNDKRIRLVKGAEQLFHQQGINSTTLADIAQLANVPLGNVYYYFKSKESIILAVIENRLQILQQLLDELNNITNPKERLKQLLSQLISDQETITKFGDALGSLCLELGKQPGELHKSVSELMQKLISWSEAQFNALNITNKSLSSKQLAINFIASIQGISLLGVTFKNLANLEEHAKFLNNWLDQVAQ